MYILKRGCRGGIQQLVSTQYCKQRKRMLYSEPGTSCSSTCDMSLPILRERHTQARTVQKASCRGRQCDHGCAD
eukprot:4072604-Prymnesium_polylepis.1